MQGWAPSLGDETGVSVVYICSGKQQEHEDTTPNQRTLLFLDDNGHDRHSQAAFGFIAFSSWIICDF
jgi:hypothetical protein